VEPSLLLIIVFILAPLIERLLRAGKGPQQPPQPRVPPEPRIPPQRRVPTPEESGQQDEPRPRVVVARRPDEDDAAAMVPDDLWEILTGERRVPRAPFPQPVPLPAPVEDDETYSLESESAGDVIVDDIDMRATRDSYTRALPQRAVPQVVSLEELEISDTKRHDRFHERLAELGAAAPPRAAARQAFRFASTEDVRRGIISAEVLGPPKGLQ
jgi:hypothetical protein